MNKTAMNEMLHIIQSTMCQNVQYNTMEQVKSAQNGFTINPFLQTV